MNPPSPPSAPSPPGLQLRDGRKIVGTLCSFDQFANLVLSGAKERIIVGEQYAEIPLGLHVVRGENVVLLGELDVAREPPPGLQLVSEAAIKQAQKAEREAEKMKGTLRARFDFLDEI
jgi:U6 snRNA-associated Sm-like protein LSm1